jgi:hypothetical protein
MSATDPDRRARQLVPFRALPVTWHEHLRALAELRAALREPPSRPRSGVPPLTIVLPVYARPANLALSLAIALRVPGVDRVVVTENDPSLRAREWAREDDPRIEWVTHPSRRGPVERYRAIASSRAEWFFSADDDLFLHPRQIRAIADALIAEPRAPHGFYGQLYEGHRFTQSIVRREGSVHVLNRAYAFSRAHLDRYLERLDELEVDRAGIGLDDDVVLSFCGDALPLVHDVGPYLDCPSEMDRRVARWRRHDAADLRARLFERLARLTPLPPAIREMAEQPRWPWAPRTLWGAAIYTASGAPLVGSAWRRAARTYARWARHGPVADQGDAEAARG